MAIINPNESGEDAQDQSSCAVSPYKGRTVIYMAAIAIAIFVTWVVYDIFF